MARGKFEYWLTEDGLTLLEGWAREGLTDEQLAGKMGIGVRTLYDWKLRYLQISQALKKGNREARPRTFAGMAVDGSSKAFPRKTLLTAQ